MTSYGRFAIDREIFESDIWEKPPYFLKVWVWIIGKANWKDVVKGKTVYRRGEFKTDIPEIIKKNKWWIGWKSKELTKNQVFNVLDFLRKTGRISTRKTTRGLWIKVINYDEDQMSPKHETNNEANGETSKETTAVQHYKRKKEKKEKKLNTVSLRSTDSPSSRAQPPLEASPTNQEKIKEVIDFYIKCCSNIRGFEPVTNKADIKMVKRRLSEGHSVEDLTSEISWFIDSKLFDELGPSLKTCLCSHAFNKWLSQYPDYPNY